jgi:hypothetical protein
MKSRVLYFPYIRVPESSWLTQTLLYWDRLSSIVPYEFIHKPESLGPYMQSLLQEELVVQVMPGAHIYEIPGFFDSFNAYIDKLEAEIEDRRKRFSQGETFRIHIEKLGDIGEMLIQRGLASQYRYPWYDVERDTAHDFMSYLAFCLGQVESINSVPMTDDNNYLGRFTGAGVPSVSIQTQLESLRIQVLNEVLPVPNHSITPAKIRAFKDRHQNELGEFRRRVERELVEASNIVDAELRQRHLEIFFDEAGERVEQICEAMHSAGWKTAKASVSVITAIPGVPVLFGLLGAVWNAFTGEGRPLPRDFAYAAYVETELSRAN